MYAFICKSKSQENRYINILKELPFFQDKKFISVNQFYENFLKKYSNVGRGENDVTEFNFDDEINFIQQYFNIQIDSEKFKEYLKKHRAIFKDRDNHFGFLIRISLNTYRSLLIHYLKTEHQVYPEIPSDDNIVIEDLKYDCLGIENLLLIMPLDVKEQSLVSTNISLFDMDTEVEDIVHNIFEQYQMNAEEAKWQTEIRDMYYKEKLIKVVFINQDEPDYLIKDNLKGLFMA